MARRVPDGVKEIKAPTAMVWIIGRTQTNGKPDYEAVHAIQRQYTLTPLSSFGKPYTPPSDVSVDPKVDMKTPPVKQVEEMDLATFFGSITRLMKDDPTASADTPLVERLASIGVVPGKEFNVGTLDSATKKGLERALVAAGRRTCHRLRAPRGQPTMVGRSIVPGWAHTGRTIRDGHTSPWSVWGQISHRTLSTP